MQGRTVKSLAGFYYVESDGVTHQTRARGSFRKKGQTPYVDDLVEFSADDHSEGYILAVHDRKNSLIRPPIVNTDQAIVIMSVKEPDFNANLLDRFLVLLGHKAIESIVYIPRMDLMTTPDEIKGTRRQYQEIGYQFCVSLEGLPPLLTDKVTAFVGQTGVGKSTLLDKVAPELKLEIGEISNSLGRGRHTTRAVSFYNVNGGKIADTPGFPSLDYEITNAEDLNETFLKLGHLSHYCRFRFCTHTHKPSCAVKEGLEPGDLWQSRCDSYLQFLSEAENRRETHRKAIKRK